MRLEILTALVLLILMKCYSVNTATSTEFPIPVTPTCPPDRFYCTNGSIICIPMDYVCDAEIDCEDGSDEYFAQDCTDSCGGSSFPCSDFAPMCLLDEWICDGEDDCPSGSDEQGCTTTSEPLITPPPPGETSKPETPIPGTPEPETPEPETPVPAATPKPATPKPETPVPAATPKPVTPKPETPKPGTPKPGTPKPGTPEPETSKPETPEPGSPKPTTTLEAENLICALDEFECTFTDEQCASAQDRCDVILDCLSGEDETQCNVIIVSLLRITEIDGSPAEFSDDLLDTNSAAFIQLSLKITLAISNWCLGTANIVVSLRNFVFSNSSIIVDFELLLSDDDLEAFRDLVGSRSLHGSKLTTGIQEILAEALENSDIVADVSDITATGSFERTDKRKKGGKHHRGRKPSRRSRRNQNRATNYGARNSRKNNRRPRSSRRNK